MISGSALDSASRAFLPSPAVIASSTARNVPRMRVSRILLIAVLLAILRVAFLAEDVFAISIRPKGVQRGNFRRLLQVLIVPTRRFRGGQRPPRRRVIYSRVPEASTQN